MHPDQSQSKNEIHHRTRQKQQTLQQHHKQPPQHPQQHHLPLVRDREIIHHQTEPTTQHQVLEHLNPEIITRKNRQDRERMKHPVEVERVVEEVVEREDLVMHPRVGKRTRRRFASDEGQREQAKKKK